jgi:ATP-dependent Clp protease ATP-binding subunit ClpA
MFERFTTPAREVVLGARIEARRLGHGFIGTEHILLAIFRNPGAMAYGILTDAGLTHDLVVAYLNRLWGLGPDDAEALSAIGIDLEAVRSKVEESFGAQYETGDPTIGRLPFSKRAKKVLELSLREALALKHGYIGTEHILLGLIRDGDGLAAKSLVASGLSLTDLRAATLAAISRAAA